MDHPTSGPDSCKLLDGVNLSDFTQAKFDHSSLTVYLLFRCDPSVLHLPGASPTNPEYCIKSFIQPRDGTQNAQEAHQSSCCVQFRPQMQEPELASILKRCSSYISFVTSNLTFEQISSPCSIQLSWSKPLYDSQCTVCEVSNGTCGYNQSGFVCYKDDHKSYLLKEGNESWHVPPHHRARPWFNFSKALVLGVLVVVVLVALAVFGAYLVRSKKLRLKSAPGDSGPTFATGLGRAFVARSFATTEFTFKELDHATEFFSDHKLLGDGGFGAVYEGRLHDGCKVAVKRLYRDNFRREEIFFNEIRILASLAHKNLVKFYGYCCEDHRDLLLVFEYVSNGTLADHLHSPTAEALPWKTRLKIAWEIAQALSYLHFTMTPPIFHRDVKSQNILLDQDFHVKLADFGLSRFVPLQASHISTTPQGTPGYLDPDYRDCYQLTDKSDVYSFGVVLVELVSALPAVDMSRNRGEINLSSLAMSKISCGAWQELLDSRLEINREPCMVDMARSVMELAFRCLAAEKENRPDTKDVERELATIWKFGYGELNRINGLSATHETSRLIKHNAEFCRTPVHSPSSSSCAFSCH